jgi:biopolymer transport protein ExbD
MNRWEEFQVRVFKIPRKTRLLKGDLDITPLIDCVFLLLIFFMLTSSFVKPAGIRVSLPKTVTADVLQEEKFVVVISADDIIYLDEKPISLDDLRERLKEAKVGSILIKADKRASLGRVIEIWDLCREIGIERVNIATVQMRKE